MEGSALSINSRSTAIKTILLAAWRGKLSNEEWENRIKKVLPRGVNGDVYDLADCLLRQALVGPVPNELFISYMKHAVKCELVSHGAVLSSIAHQATNISPIPNQSPNRTSSLICLLEFLKTFRDRISCRGTEIECLNLCHSLNQLISWLLKCVLNSIETITGISNNSFANLNSGSTLNPNYHQQQQQHHHQQQPLQQQITNTNIAMANNPGIINLDHHKSTLRIIDLCTETIHYFINRPFTKSLLFISKIEYSKEFDDILKTVQIIQQKLANCQSLQFIHDKVPHCKILQQLDVIFNSRDMHPSVVAAQQLRCLQMHRIRSTQVSSSSNFEKNIQTQSTNDSTINYALFNSLYSLIAFDVILRPARPHKQLARQIIIITNFNSAPIHMTYCELIRVCLIGLIDTEGTPAKKQWAFFTYLKMPKLLLELSRGYRSSLDLDQTSTQATSGPDCFGSNQITNFINDLKLAFERLCEYSPLLDEAEHKCNCDFFKCLVKELIRNDSGLIQLKSVDFRKFPTKRATIAINENSMGGHRILEAEPVVTSCLKTFDTEQDPGQLFDLLIRLVSGRQFEFTLSAAASTGRLQAFVKKLVEFNELNKMPRGDSPKNHQIQVFIFDITFLSLTYIAHIYGPEVIGSDQQTTFNKWYYECYNSATRINCPKEMLKNSNSDVVSSLIKQIVHPDGEIQLKSVNWGDVCFNLPAVINEILIAWSQGHLNDDDMQGVMERIKSKMCFIAVVSATWLQCHIRTLNETDKSKPLQMLQNLTKASQHAKQQKQQQQHIAPADLQSKYESYSERSSLMTSIIRKIFFELVPKTSNLSSGSALSANQQATNNTSTAATTTNNSSDLNPGVTVTAGTANAGDNVTTAASTTTVPATTTTTTTAATTTTTASGSVTAETACQSINDRFVSTLTTQEIFLANVKQCLSRGWIDHKSLNSLNSLFKMIGSECFTNLIVEQILTSHESPSDLSRAVNITFGLFHLDIEACAFALLRDTIPSWLMGEKKQVLLNQPRAFALAHLTVMTIIEVFSNLRTSQANGSATGIGAAGTGAGQNQMADAAVGGKMVNGIKQESGQARTIMLDIDGQKGTKRMKMSTASADNDKDMTAVDQADVTDRIDKLDASISDLMRLFKEIMSDSVMSQRTLFPVLFLQQTVVCTRENSTVITVHLQPEILLDIINLFSSELTFELVLAISNLSSTNSRKFAAKAMCQLAEVKEKSTNENRTIAKG